MGYIGRYTAPSIVDLESPVSVDGTTIIENGVLKNVGIDGIKLKSSGDSITKSDGTTAVLSESSGVVTLNNGTIGNGVVFPADHIVQVQYANFHGIKELPAPVNSWTDLPELAIEFTCKTANPKIFLQGQVLWSSDRTNGWAGAHIKYIKKVGTANWVDVQVNSGNHGGQVASNQGGLIYVSDSHYNEPFTYTWVDTLTCSAGTTLKFRPQVIGSGYTNYAKIRINYVNSPSTTYSGGGTSNLTVMEIQS